MKEKYQYDLDEKLDHIAYMFNVRTAGKAYENFIVNAIYTKVGEPELIPITQQYVRTSQGKYYLLDLFFPQLNYGIEVDEPHHEKEGQKILDKNREEDIREVIGCDIDHISIKAGEKNRSYEEVSKDIDRVVQNIIERIKALPALKWLTYKEKKEEVLKKGRFSVSDDIDYPSITEIYNMCGGKRSGKERGPVKMLQRCYYRLNPGYSLWVPILAETREDGTIRNSKMGFKNTLSPDRAILTEQSDQLIDTRFDTKHKRVVFMRMRDFCGRPCIKFIGVFEIEADSEDKHLIRTYRRIAKEVNISELQP